MSEYFEVKIKRDKTLENGMQKKVTEAYLVDALTFTESEARIIEELSSYISGEFTIKGIRRSNYTEILQTGDEMADKFYKVKMILVQFDDSTGMEKSSTVTYLVQERDVRNAYNVMTEYMKSYVADYHISSIAETPIIEVINYKSRS